MPRLAATKGATPKRLAVLVLAAGCAALLHDPITRAHAAEQWNLTRALDKARIATLQETGTSSSELLLYDGFETGKIGTGWTGYAFHPRTTPPESSDSIDIVTDPVRRGTYALKVTVQPEDAVTDEDTRLDKERGELVRLNLCRDGVCRFGEEGREGNELWYAWSVLFPTDYEYVDTTPYNYQISGQWHDQAAPGTTPSANSPPISVHYSSSAAGARLRIKYGLLQTGGAITTLETPIQKGRWVDLMFHIRFSQGSGGFLEVWKDGVMLALGDGTARITGPNMYNSEPNYLRLGLYRGKGQLQTNTFYLDEIKIATSRAALLGR